jgi:hypothetical protein
MPVVQTAVLLFAFPHPSPVNLPDPAWFVSYFFSPKSGQKAYWLKESDNSIVLEGAGPLAR